MCRQFTCEGVCRTILDLYRGPKCWKACTPRSHPWPAAPDPPLVDRRGGDSACLAAEKEDVGGNVSTTHDVVRTSIRHLLGLHTEHDNFWTACPQTPCLASCPRLSARRPQRRCRATGWGGGHLAVCCDTHCAELVTLHWSGGVVKKQWCGASHQL